MEFSMLGRRKNLMNQEIAKQAISLGVGLFVGAVTLTAGYILDVKRRKEWEAMHVRVNAARSEAQAESAPKAAEAKADKEPKGDKPKGDG